MRMMHVAFLVVLTAAIPVRGQSVQIENLVQRYQDLLLLTTDDYQKVDVATTVFQDHLLPQFSRGVQDAKSYSYDYRGVPAYYEKKEPATTEEEKALEEANNRLLRFFRNTLPMLAYAYQTPEPSPGANPHYQNDEVLALYLDGLDYCYSPFMRHPLASSNLHNSPITRTLQQSHLARIVDDCRSVH